jgi:hypothetical protein
MYVLSFRDMSQRARGATTDASLYRVDPVDPAYAWDPFQPLSLQPVDAGAFAQDVQGAHVGFIVHGFNVNRDSGFASGGAMAQEFRGQGPLAQIPAPDMLDLLTPAVDFFIPVLWPGDWLQWLPVNYPFVLGTARVVGRNFAQFLTSSTTTIRRASFFTHSFGARVALETVQQATTPQPGVGQGRPPPVFDTAILTAAAATETVLDSPFYASAVAALRRIAVVSAPTDEVLTKWFPLGNPVEQALWANDPGPNIALGRDGPVLLKDSPARGKTDWYVVTDTRAPMGQAIDQHHGDYMPAPDTPVVPLPNGWSDKRERIARLSQAVFDGTVAPWPARATIPEA